MTLQSMLLVEDDPFSQTVAATILEYYGIQVDVAQSAEEGLQLLGQKAYDAALIDLALPTMDGWTLLQHIQANPATSQLPCFAITAYHGAHVAQQAIRSGFRAFFPKPLQPETFMDDLMAFL